MESRAKVDAVIAANAATVATMPGTGDTQTLEYVKRLLASVVESVGAQYLGNLDNAAGRVRINPNSYAAS